MTGKNSSLKIVLRSMVNFVVLIVVLIILNVLLSSIHNNTYIRIVDFLTSLLGLFFILFLVGMITSLLWNFPFPLNLLAPVSSGALGVFILNLFYRILEFSQTFFYFSTLERILSYNLYVYVFFITLIIGYLIIFVEENNKRESEPKEKIEGKVKKESVKKKIKEEDSLLKGFKDETKKVFNNIEKAVRGKSKEKNKKVKKK